MGGAGGINSIISVNNFMEKGWFGTQLSIMQH